MKRVLILGAGMGGVATATALRRRLDPGDEVVLIDRRTSFVMGLRRNWSLAGLADVEDGERGLGLLGRQGIRVVHGKINEIFPADCAVEVDTTRLQGDAMVVALGASRQPRAIPGFTEHAIDYYDPDVAWNGGEAIRQFKGGRLVVGIFGAPYPCPPAPYELALLLAERFGRDRIPGEILLFTPQPDSLPILGAAGSQAFDGRLAAAGITFRPKIQATAVEPGAVIADGARIPFDLLIGVAPHRVPPVVAQSGLTRGKPWVHADRETLQTGVPNVYAVGDCVSIPLSNGMWLPKTGSFAHAQAEVVAARLADQLAGREPSAVFGGAGTCFVETGQGRAAELTGSFFADPPAVNLGDDSEAGRAAKVAFEADRLRDWFGG